MRELHLAGWLYRDHSGLLNLSKSRNPKYFYDSNIIVKKIEYFAPQVCEVSDGLGGYRSCILNANLRVYATDKECSLDEAMASLAAELDGLVLTDVRNEGYSEWTITGYYVKEFYIGGHDLDRELDQYVGKYIHFVLEYEN